MVQYVEPNFAPDSDTSWSVNPGALSYISFFAPLQNRAYGSMARTDVSDTGGLTGADHIVSYMFRQVTGTVRLLTFREANIDEYDNTFTKTNRGTGYSTAANWCAAAWGNQIIAVSKANATQSSTGAGFTALGGGSPKAGMVASNVNFVMLADVDDSGSNVYPDMVWWSAIRNPASWTPSLATQAGNVRLLDSPGPITALVAYRNLFVAFKENSIFVGQYVGPPYVFSWQMVSSRVGCVGPHAVTELDGKLYFMCSSGFFEFDGQSITNVGMPVFQSFASEAGYLTGFSGDYLRGSGTTPFSISKVQAVADEAEGIAWFASSDHTTTTQNLYLYGYNVRAGKWGRAEIQTTGSSATIPTSLVRATTADHKTFFSSTSSRFYVIFQASTDATMAAFTYPDDLSEQANFTTGIWGDQQNAEHVTRFYLRHRKGSDALTNSNLSGILTKYTTEAQTDSPASVTCVYNPEFTAFDGLASSRHKTMQVTYNANFATVLAGFGLDGGPAGKR